MFSQFGLSPSPESPFASPLRLKSRPCEFNAFANERSSRRTNERRGDHHWKAIWGQSSAPLRGDVVGRLLSLLSWVALVVGGNFQIATTTFSSPSGPTNWPAERQRSSLPGAAPSRESLSHCLMWQIIFLCICHSESARRPLARLACCPSLPAD